MKVVMVEGPTREHEPQRVSGALRSCREAGVRRVETETVHTLDNIYLFTELSGQRYEAFSIAAYGDGSPKTSSGLRGQCRRDEETSPVEVEEWVHELRIYASRRTVVDGVRVNEKKGRA